MIATCRLLVAHTKMEAAPRATRYFVPFRPKHGAALPTLKSSGRRVAAGTCPPKRTPSFIKYLRIEHLLSTTHVRVDIGDHAPVIQSVVRTASSPTASCPNRFAAE